MKLTFTRASVLLALALGLTACGGKASFQLSGTVTGLEYPGLVLTNINNSDAVTVAVPTPVGNTTFKLGQTIEYGQLYDVRITGTPEHQTCSLFGGADTAGRLSTINIAVACSVQQFNIGGTVSGLRAAADAAVSTGLVITNGSDKLAIEADGVYVMPTKVPYAKSYGVTIVSQPTAAIGKTCTIEHESGVVNTIQLSVGVQNPVDNINVKCA